MFSLTFIHHRLTPWIVTGITAAAAGFVVQWSNLESENPIVPHAAASWAPAAEQLADEIREDILKFGSGASLIANGQELINQGKRMQAEASATAKGRDNILCAEFKARLDRGTKLLIADENCPLL